MHYATNLSLHGRSDRDDESAIAKSRSGIFLYESFCLSRAQNAVQNARDATFGLCQFATYA